MTRAINLAIFAAPLLVLAACSGEQSASDDGPQTPNLVAVDPDAVAETLSWRDLIPDEDLEAIQQLNEGVADPSLIARYTGQTPVENQPGTFNVVDDLDQLVVRMPGYILPLDYATQGQAREFLLLPYHGACVHYPPPPPNQIVYLRASEPVAFSSLWEPVWVEGRMEIERIDTDLAAAAYSMTIRSVTPYQP